MTRNTTCVPLPLQTHRSVECQDWRWPMSEWFLLILFHSTPWSWTSCLSSVYHQRLNGILCLSEYYVYISSTLNIISDQHVMYVFDPKHYIWTTCHSRLNDISCMFKHCVVDACDPKHYAWMACHKYLNDMWCILW